MQRRIEPWHWEQDGRLAFAKCQGMQHECFGDVQRWITEDVSAAAVVGEEVADDEAVIGPSGLPTCRSMMSAHDTMKSRCRAT
jgi:hypothetical protein